MKRTIKDLIKQGKKLSKPTIDSSATIYDALVQLKNFDSGVLLVIKDGKLVGLFSERDFIRRCGLFIDKDLLNMKINVIYQSRVCFVTSDYRLDECLAVMSKINARHLPVFEDEELIGLISIKDITNALIEEKDFEIEQLLKYVSGGELINFISRNALQLREARVLATHDMITAV